MEENKNKYALNFKIKLLDEQFKEIPSIPTFDKTFEEGGFLIRKKNEIKIIDSQSKIKKKDNEVLLFRIRMDQKNNLIKLESPISNSNNFQTEELFKSLDSKLWYLLNSINKEENNTFQYSLLEGDIIKFGERKYIVHELYKVNQNEEQDNNNIDNNGYDDINYDSKEFFSKIPEIDKYQKCKFCDTYNVCLCGCKNIIHYSCLKKYVKDNIKKKENKSKTIKSYYLDNFNCKYCYSPYPISLILKKLEIRYDVIPIDKPEDNNYLILESFGDKNDKNYKKSVYVITLDKKSIFIGRNENNDIIIDDNSVENLFAEIKFDKKKNKVILESINNDFQIAVLIRQSLKMKEETINIQTGITQFEAKLIKKDI